MYNCELDSLIMTGDLKIFDRDEGNTTLNVSTILSIWYALNFQNYFDKSNIPFPEFERVHIKSNFKEQAGKKLAIYTQKCTKPMTEAEGNDDDDFKVSLEYLSSPILCEMKTTLLSLRELLNTNS